MNIVKSQLQQCSNTPTSKLVRCNRHFSTKGLLTLCKELCLQARNKASLFNGCGRAALREILHNSLSWTNFLHFPAKYKTETLKMYLLQKFCHRENDDCQKAKYILIYRYVNGNSLKLPLEFKRNLQSHCILFSFSITMKSAIHII